MAAMHAFSSANVARHASGRAAAPARVLQPFGKTCFTTRRVSHVSNAVAAPSTLTEESYMCLGLAHCYEKNNEGKLSEILVIEPLSASSLECMAAGARTSFKAATGIQYGEALGRKRDSLPDEFQTAVFCDSYEYRCEAAARTWTRPHAQDNLMDIVPLGKVRSQWNFCLDDKRVLNMVNVVSDEDNVKQDLSIDVYGRKKKEEAAAKLAEEQAKMAAATEAAKAKDEDDLDKLLSL